MNQIYFLIYIFIHLYMINHIIANYHIKENHIPSYFYGTFRRITEDIFPQKITIVISLSKVSGTLFYSIDYRMNQFIVSLTKGREITLRIELNNQPYYVSLSQLCGCEICTFQILEISFTIEDVLYVQCNKMPRQSFTYRGLTKGINKAYPIPYGGSETNIGPSKEAHLWLVNTEYNGKYQNNDQLSGCIFHIKYWDEEMKFSKITDNIARECIKTCTNDICNGGQCLETYNVVPICNCTATFKNGDYCNDTIKSINIQSKTESLMFEMLKLSWNSNSTDIMKLQNKNISIVLYVKEKYLAVDILWLVDGFSKHSQTVNMRGYQMKTNTILIVKFKKLECEVMFFNNGPWQKHTIPINSDLTQELFSIITLKSGDGVMDIVYKTDPNEYKWHRIENVNGKDYTDGNNSRLLQSLSPFSKLTTTHWIVIGIISIFVIAMILCLGIMCNHKRYISRKIGGCFAHRSPIFRKGTEVEITDGPATSQHLDSDNPKCPILNTTEPTKRRLTKGTIIEVTLEETTLQNIQ